MVNINEEIFESASGEKPETGAKKLQTLVLAGVLVVVAVGVSAWWTLPPLLIVVQAALILGAVFLAAAGFSEAKATTSSQSPWDANQFALILQQLEDVVFLYDKNFKILFWNGAAQRLFGVAESEIVGHVLTPQDAENPRHKLLAQVLFPSLAPGMVSRSPAGVFPQITDLSFNDPFLELRVTSLLLGEKENPSGFAKVVRDRTREMSLIKSKSEFVTIASHQLRTPTTGIHWALESLHADSSKFDPNVRLLIDGAYQGSETLLKIIDDLLGIAKIEEGRFGYTFTTVDLVQFLNKLLGEILPVATRAGVSLYFDAPKETVSLVTADPQKLAMVVSNLVENAIRYNVKNGNVTVGLKPTAEGPYMEITVKDTGIGIPPDEIKNLFTKFFRADNAIKLQTEGSGLGLYIVRSIIQAHGGRIWVDSELERGTTFHFTLATDPKFVPRHEVPLS